MLGRNGLNGGVTTVTNVNNFKEITVVFENELGSFSSAMTLPLSLFKLTQADTPITVGNHNGKNGNTIVYYVSDTNIHISTANMPNTFARVYGIK